MRIGDKKTYEQIEIGLYEAELIDYTDLRDDGSPMMSNGFQGGEPKPQWRFRFELLDYPEPGRQISAWINKPKDMGNVAPNSNLVLMASALIPGLGPDDDWDLPDLLHCRCRVQVESYTKKDGTEGTGIGKYYPPKAAKGEARPESARAAPVPTLAQRTAARAKAAMPEQDALLDAEPPF